MQGMCVFVDYYYTSFVSTTFILGGCIDTLVCKLLDIQNVIQTFLRVPSKKYPYFYNYIKIWTISSSISGFERLQSKLCTQILPETVQVSKRPDTESLTDGVL